MFALLVPSAKAPGNAVGSPVPLRVSARGVNDAELSWPDGGDAATGGHTGGSVAEVRTTGRDPYLFAEPVDGKPIAVPTAARLSFEYFSPTGAGAVEVFADPLPNPPTSVTGPRLSVAEGWVTYALDVRPALPRGDPAGPGDPDRLGQPAEQDRPVAEPDSPSGDRGGSPGGRRAGGQAGRRRRLGRKAGRIPVGVVPGGHGSDGTSRRPNRARGGDGRRRPTGAERRGPLVLAELPLWADPTDLSAAVSRTPLSVAADGRFAVAVDRTATVAGRPHDRLLSRWVVATSGPDTGTTAAVRTAAAAAAAGRAGR